MLYDHDNLIATAIIDSRVSFVHRHLYCIVNDMCIHGTKLLTLIKIQFYFGSKSYLLLSPDAHTANSQKNISSTDRSLFYHEINETPPTTISFYFLNCLMKICIASENICITIYHFSPLTWKVRKVQN